MSKSIYEKALEKIDVEFDSWERAEYFELLELVEQALEQAQKQEKVLNKIKEIIDRPYNPNIMPMFEKPERYNEIVKQIKELENE